MKTKLERLARILILAPLAPLAGLLACWWAAYAWLPESWIPFISLLLGIFGLLLYRHRIRKADQA